MAEAGFVAALQTGQAGQSRSVGPLQSQGGICREVTALFPRMVKVTAHEQEGSKHALHHQGFASFGLLARLGDVGLINAINGLLQKRAHQFIGGLENGGPHEDFQLGNGGSSRFFAAESGDQVLDLRFLGEADVLIGRFFLAPARRSSRERALRA